jgi:hypothetical protein
MADDQDLEDRLRRAGSWIDAAARMRGQDGHRHAEFLLLYVAFNSLHGRRQYDGTKTDVQQDLDDFLIKVKAMRRLDEGEGGSIVSTALDKCWQGCEGLLASPFHRDDYWSRRVDAQTIRARCGDDLERCARWLKARRFEDVLRVVLRRITVLRNQVVHGCVTYGPSSKGIDGLKDGVVVLRALAPAFHRLVVEQGSRLEDLDLRWEPLPYPRLESRRHPTVGVLD